MSRNDRSDSLSVRQDDDARAPLKRMQQEVEQELLRAESTRSGGVDHQSRRDREGKSAEPGDDDGQSGSGA